MNKELIEAIQELTKAHIQVADNIGRLATCFEVKPDDVSPPDHKYGFGDALTSGVSDISSALHELVEHLQAESDSENEGD